MFYYRLKARVPNIFRIEENGQEIIKEDEYKRVYAKRKNE